MKLILRMEDEFLAFAKRLTHPSLLVTVRVLAILTQKGVVISDELVKTDGQLNIMVLDNKY